MDEFEVKDENGKSFKSSIQKVCDIRGDFGDDAQNVNIADSMRNRVNAVHDVEYVNQNGEAVDALQILNDAKSGKISIAALDVQMEATHSGKNHNHCIYYEDSMEKDAETFINPFKKPVLKNHDSYSGEPIGRITQSWFGPSQLTDERSAIHLKTRITDKDAMEKFLDGRYSTVSIGGTMGTVTCNICGKTLLKDGKFKFCGHWRGESYKDQLCYWGARDINYHEVSVVNTPADDFAQVMKVTVVTDSEKDKNKNDDNRQSNNKEENTMDGSNTKSKDEQKKAISDFIDKLLGADTNKDEQASEPADNTDNTEDTTNHDNAADNANNSEADSAEDSTKELDEVKKQLKEAQDKITALEKDLADAKSETDKAKKELEDSKEESEGYKDMCLTLASANKELLADSIVAKEVAADVLKEDKATDRKKELLGMSAKELEKLAAKDVKKEDTSDSTTQRQMADVKSPVLANPDSNGSADTNKDSADGKEARSTVDDFADDIVSKLFKL